MRIAKTAGSVRDGGHSARRERTEGRLNEVRSNLDQSPPSYDPSPEVPEEMAAETAFECHLRWTSGKFLCHKACQKEGGLGHVGAPET